MPDSRKRKTLKDNIQNIKLPEIKTPNITLFGGKKLQHFDLIIKILAGAFLVAIIVAVVLLCRSCANKNAEAAESQSIQQAEAARASAAMEETQETTMSAEQIEESKAQAEAEAEEKAIMEIVDSYPNLAICKVDDDTYLNIRETPDQYADIVGKLPDKAACSLEDEEPTVAGDITWQKITSGDITGYVSNKFLATGEEAREIAHDEVRERAIIMVDTLYLRAEPSKDARIITSLMAGERYDYYDVTDGWVHLENGYVAEADFDDPSNKYVEFKTCLNEAQKYDMKGQVLGMYDNLGISTAKNYVNIRDGASEDAKIIGKLTSHAGADILGEEGNWYHIQSGPVKGYVSKDYIVTGNEAAAVALDEAQLMVIVNEDVLNVRTGPSKDAGVWTQIVNNERYPVVSQLDGWVEIDLGDTDEDGNAVTAYVSTDCVTVRYALNEAIKFSPLEEKAANSSRIRNKVVNYALQFLGNPYVWGGTSLTNGCDCSGFTMGVLGNSIGVYLPHYSVDQSKMGVKVTSDTMRPGDLVFYANSSGTINHVAIYIGNGQVVHASNRKSGIKISTWNYRSPKAIRNVIGD